MGLGLKLSVLVLLYFAFSGEETRINADTGSSNCNFPAIFNFGDSNSDTGGYDSIKHEVHWPNGKTFGKVSKRVADGRLIIDFLAESLGFSYLKSDLDTEAASYKNGANFAFAGRRITPDGANDVYNFDGQVSRFLSFKSRAIASKEPESTNMYPKPEAFSEALYTIDIGQNDVMGKFGGGNASYTADFFIKSVQRLLNDGAKNLWVHNTCPWGCLPYALQIDCSPQTCTFDKYGCKNEWNQKSQQLNSELKKRIDELRNQFPNAVITFVDVYSAKLQLRANNNGFSEELKMKYCCGVPGVWCGQNGTVAGNTVFGDACEDPSKYLSWDSIHFTEAANKIVANLILDGSFSEPRVPFSQACHKPQSQNLLGGMLNLVDDKLQKLSNFNKAK